MSKPLAIFSGQCFMGVCGTPAGFNDMRGTPLRVGDIVATFTVRENKDADGEWLDYFPDSLTAIVADGWDTYQDGSIEERGEHVAFPMGIRSVAMDEPGNWRVLKLKGYEAVIDGEHWSAYGFNYGQVPAALEQQP